MSEWERQRKQVDICMIVTTPYSYTSNTVVCVSQNDQHARSVTAEIREGGEAEYEPHRDHLRTHSKLPVCPFPYQVILSQLLPLAEVLSESLASPAQVILGPRIYIFIYILKAYIPVNRTGSPQGFSLVWGYGDQSWVGQEKLNKTNVLLMGGLP